jgi:hypothetical protein
MPIELRFTLTFADYVQAQHLHAKRGLWPRLSLFLAYILLPLFGVFWLLFAVFFIRITESPGFFVFEVGVGLFLVCYPLYMRWRWKRCYLRTRTESEETTIEMDQSTIRIQASKMRSEIQWAGVRSYSESQKLFMLYVAPAKFVAIPKRACSEHQIDELRSLFRQAVGAVRQ